jgi:inner membrane protein
MPTIITHAVVALGLGRLFTARKMPRLAFWGALVGLAIVPDIDVLWLRFGVPYGAMLGHRGLTHSLPFALVLSALVAAICYRACRVRYWDLWGLFFVVAASHGILDACTHGGPYTIHGTAFFAPFASERYWLPWRPMQASLFLGSGFFSNPWTLVTLRDEFLWVWLPLGLLVGVVELFRTVPSPPPLNDAPPGSKPPETK